MKSYYIYIMTSKKNGTLYIGITNDLIKRVFENKKGLVERFTKKYQVNKLVYFEETQDVESAIMREKKLKDWKRKWKLELIEKTNPKWDDLYDKILDSESSSE